MSLPIADYAFIGNMQTAALVGRNGSIDWFCIPRFDSPACFTALLGGPEHGRWLIAPAQQVTKVLRRYRGNTLVLETIFETDDGAVALIDFMPIGEHRSPTEIIRIVQGREGAVPMVMELILRFNYGEISPSSEEIETGWLATAGADAILLRLQGPLSREEQTQTAQFTITKGQTIPFALTRYDSHLTAPEAANPELLLDGSEVWWKEWSSRCTYRGPHRKEVLRSLITLKALTFRPTGAIIGAPTTSLPERSAGSLNWDYRYCWIRDSTFALCALLIAGYGEEVIAWRQWLMRAIAGDARQLQTIYGVAGERRLSEFELSYLPGYDRSMPVRVGNAAYEQFQLDIYGEIVNAFYIAHQYQIEINAAEWQILCVLLKFLETAWRRPDDGIWEVRSGARHFTESKVATWVAFDRAIKLIENHGFEGPKEQWQTIRDEIHEEVCTNGFDRKRETFVQSYGSNQIDASLLRIPLVGFLPATDDRIVKTVDQIQKELVEHGLVRRHVSDAGDTDVEGAFLPCSFWLVDCLVGMGRIEEATTMYEGLLNLCNDVGLLSEEYDPDKRLMLGNFPQALTHLALINSTFNLFHNEKPLMVASGARYR